jgi:23S rRNA (adenine2503-C2)-methyltransferase
MRIDHMRQRLRVHGAKLCHEQRVLQAWARAISVDTRHRRAEDFLPLTVRDALPTLIAPHNRGLPSDLGEIGRGLGTDHVF